MQQRSTRLVSGRGLLQILTPSGHNQECHYEDMQKWDNRAQNKTHFRSSSTAEQRVCLKASLPAGCCRHVGLSWDGAVWVRVLIALLCTSLLHVTMDS